MSFTHLHVHSNFSFLDGGSSVKSLLDRAKETGCDSLALTDHNGLYGAVRFCDYAQKIGIKPIVGVEMDVEQEAPSLPHNHLILLAKNLEGYSNLCRIITRAHLSHEKGDAAACLEVIAQYHKDIFCLSGCEKGFIRSRIAEGDIEGARGYAMRLVDIFGRDNFLIELQNHMLPGDGLVNARLSDLADDLGLRCVATNNVHHAIKDDFRVQDVLVCVRTLTTLDEGSPERKRNAEYYMKTPKAMANLFRRYSKAVAATDWVARQCNLDLRLGTFRFPEFTVPDSPPMGRDFKSRPIGDSHCGAGILPAQDGETAYSYLCKLCFDALERLYKPITPQVLERLQHELAIIYELGFPEYFLAVWDIVRFAKSRGIRCSGRGSAADSLVVYCLGITIVDPIEHNLLFERFMNPERKGMPDIDIDFDAARREEVINYIYERFGEDKVATVCTVSTLRARSSIRDIGKAMDFAPEDIDALASALPHVGSKRIREAMEKLPELRDSRLPVQKMQTLIDMCEKVDDYPRHLSVHLCGLIVSREPLTDLVPLEWATKGVIVGQFDKDDIETLGLVKMDILGLRNLSAIEDALKLIPQIPLSSEGRAGEGSSATTLCFGTGFRPEARQGNGTLDIDNIPFDDPYVYELLRSTDTIGLFQVESPGMRGLLGRLQPANFGDIIAQISLFRPGPMQADMITPFIARRHGEEPVTYLHPSLKPVLEETYGVILYQEQVISVSHALAGFTYGQADSLRRAMTTDRSQAQMEGIKDSFISGAMANRVDTKIAEEVFSRLRAFAAYGFCKAHAASFARIAYQTAYLKVYYPAEFLCGILRNEPMGFYPPNVIIEDARRHGIGILGVDVNRSDAKFTVEYPSDLSDLSDRSDSSEGPSIRIGLSQVKNISEAEMESIITAREDGEFSSFSDFRRRTRLDRPTVENLINCGAFDSFGVSSRKLLWLLDNAPKKPARERPHGSAGVLTGMVGPTLLSGVGIYCSDEEAELAALPDVPDISPHERVRMEYDILGMSALCHPMVFYRDKLARAGVMRTNEFDDLPNNTIVTLAGVVVVCMRPPTRSGNIVVFITLEDEAGVADCVVFPKVYERYGTVIYGNPALIVEGKLQKMGDTGKSIVVQKVKPLTANFRSDDSGNPGAFKERRRIAGTRSFVRSVGV